MDTYLQIAQHINEKIRQVLPSDFPPGTAGQIFNIVSIALTEDGEEQDYSNVRQCPLCRQRVVLEDYSSLTQDADNRFKQPCNKCQFRSSDDEEYPCRWCLNR